MYYVEYKALRIASKEICHLNINYKLRMNQYLQCNKEYK